MANVSCELIKVSSMEGYVITSNLLVALPFMFSLLLVLTPFLAMNNDIHLLCDFTFSL